MSEQSEKPVTVPAIRKAKGDHRLAMVTAYDFPSARLVDQSGVDLILVGDSLGMVVLGYDDTLSVTMDDMIHHTRAAARGTKRALVVGDMPYLSYHVSTEETIRNAGALIRAGARAVKLEGGKPSRLEMIQGLLDAEIPVMGHIGLTPQSVNRLGGFKVQGKAADDAKCLIDEAIALDEIGCFSLVLECVPAEVAAYVTERVSIPTIGIGAGPACDGQVLVYHDLLGMFHGRTARFVREYAQTGETIVDAIGHFVDDVREGRFPDLRTESFHVTSDEELERLYASFEVKS